MANKESRAEVLFGGKVEASVHESFEKFNKQLEGIQEKAKETTETLKTGEQVSALLRAPGTTRGDVRGSFETTSQRAIRLN